MGLPSVSVVIATYNRLAFLGQSVDSILDQTWPGTEIIVVDDASTDGSREFIDRRYGERVVYRRHESQLGPSAARNTGIENAQGELVAFHDSDDVAYPGRLVAQAQAFEADPELVLIGGQVDYYDIDLKEIFQRPKMLAPSDLEIRLIGLFMQPVSFGSSMARLAVIRRHGLRLNPDYPAAEDYDFVLRLLRLGRAKNLSQPVIKYRCHNEQQSSRASSRMRDIQRQLSQVRLAEIGLEIDQQTRAALEHLIVNPDTTLKDFGSGGAEANGLMLLVQSYRLLLQVLDALARVEPPRPGELAALRQALRERCMAAIGL